MISNRRLAEEAAGRAVSVDHACDGVKGDGGDPFLCLRTTNTRESAALEAALLLQV